MTKQGMLLSTTQINTLQTDLLQLGRQNGVRFVVLADFSGQDIVSWDSTGTTDTATVAALAAGDMMATLEIGRVLGGSRACNLVVQEHDDQTVVIARVGEGLLLLLATARDIPLGWTRLALKRTVERVLAVVGTVQMSPPPPAISDDFEQVFNDQLKTIW